MNNKNIIFLTIFYLNSTLIGMESEKIIPVKSTGQWHLDKIFEDHRWISSVCIDPTERLLAVVPCAELVYISDLQSGKKMAFLSFNHGITSICFNHDGTKFATLSHKPETCIFDIKKDENELTLNQIDSFAHDGAITSIHFDNNDNLLGVKSIESSQNKVRINNLKTNEKIISFKHNSWIITTAVSPSGKFLATGSGNNKACLFDIKGKEKIKIFELNSSVSALVFDPFEKLLAIASRDNKVHIFDLETYLKTAMLEHDKQVLSMHFGPSGNILVTGSFDSKIRIFVKQEIK